MRGWPNALRTPRYVILKNWSITVFWLRTQVAGGAQTTGWSIPRRLDGDLKRALVLQQARGLKNDFSRVFSSSALVEILDWVHRAGSVNVLGPLRIRM